MTEPTDKAAEQSLFAPTTREDFAASGLNEFLADRLDADGYALEAALREAAVAAETESDAVRERVFALIAGLMSFHMRMNDPAEVFGAKLIIGERRSMIPSDVRGEQTAVIADETPAIVHPHVRARMGDVAFMNDRRHHEAGRAAMDAYCAVADGLLDGTTKPGIPGIELGMHDVVKPITRAIDLMRLLNKRGVADVAVARMFARAWTVAREGGHFIPFVELSDAGMPAGLLTFDEVSAAAEALAAAAPDGAYPEAVKRVWLLAAQCHSRSGRKDDDERCRVEAVEQTLRMRDQCDGSLAKASWTKRAIGELRQVSGMKERVRQLLEEMRQFQLAAPDEMATFNTPIDLTEERERTIELFERLTLPEAFLQMLALAEAPDVDELRKVAVEGARDSIVDTIFGANYLDADGKTIARISAPDMDGDPDEDWIKAKCIRHMSIVRHQLVNGFIEPARRTLLDRFSVEERHLVPITHTSPFVPPGYGNVFSLGFARMFQGDYVSAAHILFPQLENSLRHMLVLANADPTKVDADLLQGDRALGALLDVNRGDLEGIWGRDIVQEIDILFNFRPGPSLRNELAHGKLPWGAFHSPETITACWFIFNLACRPIFDRWQASVAPAIEMEL